MPVSRFLLLLTALAAIVLGLAYALMVGLEPPRSFPTVAIAVLLAYLGTALAYVVAFPSLDKKTNTFVAAMLTGMVVKMFAGLISIVVVALRFPEVKGEYVAGFLVGYMVFTSFEVFGLIRKLRPHSKDLKNS